MKTLFKILIPLFFVFSAKSQVTNIQGSTINMSGFGANAANLTMKLPTSYRIGSYLQIGIGNAVNWNYAIDSAWYLGGVLSLRRASHDTLTLAISGGGSGVSSVAAGFGMNFSTITTSGSVAADSFTLATRLRVKKQIDSLAALIGAGGVTSVAAGFGTVFSTITSTGSVIIDSFTIATRLRVKKQIDSLSALLSSYVPTARTLTHSSGFGTTVTGGTQDLSSNRTWSYATDSTSGGLLSWVRGKKIADSLGVIIATKGVGSVTSVAAGYGLNFTTITGSGSVISDTFAMATRARVQKPIDSLDAAIIAGYVPTSRTVAGFALSSNVTLASLTIGSGLSGTTSTYNGSTAVTISAGDLSATYWALNGNIAVAGSQSGSFLGAINNVSLRFRSNNVEVAKIDSLGSRLFLENGLNPLLSLKQSTTAQEFQIRVGLNTGISNSNFNIYDVTNSKIRMIMSGVNTAFGNVTTIPNSSQLYIYGGGSGANIDSRPDSTFTDDANIEVENAAYDNVSSPFFAMGLAMEHSGNTSSGNLWSYSLKNLSQLRFNAVTNLIRVSNNASLRFGTNNTEYAVLDSNGRFGIGNKLPTYTLDVTGTSRITSTFYLSGNTYNSGVNVVPLVIDTLTNIVYRKTGSSSGVTSVSGTSNRITSTGGTTPVIDISASYVGQSSITTLGTITTGVWNGTAIANANLANSTISGISLGSNLASHTVGFGLSGSAYNGSSAIAWTTDSTSGGVQSWVRGKKIIDSLGVVIATKGTGTVTSVASGFGTTFSTITTTGTIVGDSTSGGFESWVRGLKVKDSLVAWGNATFVPLTRTVNGKALSSNITLSLASADFANQGTTTTVLHGNASGNPSFGAIVNADITNSTIDLTTKVTGTLPVANGGTGITSLGTGIATWLGAPSSANLAAAITDETGTGLLVFGTAPTLSNPVVGTQSTGDNSTKAASTAYVTTAISNAISGTNPAVAVQAATTANVSGYTYNNGVSGVGATLTQNSAAVVVIDGYTLLLNDRVLFKNQTTGANNGVYVITTLGTGVIPAVFTRATDYNQPSDINNTGAIPVVNGTVNATTSWLLTSTVTTVGTDALTYTQFSYSPTVIALTTNPLSQFAATTSSQLLGVLSDETGTGLAVFNNTPTIITPSFTTGFTIGGSATSRKILVGNGTNFVASTETWAVPGTSGNVLTSDGTNWTSAAPVVTASSTNTFTNKRWTVRVGSTTSSGTPTINTDNFDIYKLTAQSAAITSFTTNLSGTPVDGDALEIQITDDGTARAITFGASFVNGTVSLPTTTVISTTLTVDLKYYSTSSFGNGKWVCVAYY